jgi:ArsR family transcriptional regulator, arsenate/arsenite/antimonite-responsive transcriptional repressor
MHLISVKAESIFQALADPIRIRIVRLLALSGEECCLCELVDSLLEPQYTLSKHVKVLKQVGLLTAEKDGRWVYHRLVRGVPYLERLYSAVLALPDADNAFGSDLARFNERMCLREKGRCRVGIQRRELKVAQNDPGACRTS